MFVDAALIHKTAAVSAPRPHVNSETMVEAPPAAGLAVVEFPVNFPVIINDVKII